MLKSYPQSGTHSISVNSNKDSLLIPVKFQRKEPQSQSMLQRERKSRVDGEMGRKTKMKQTEGTCIANVLFGHTIYATNPFSAIAQCTNTLYMMGAEDGDGRLG